MQKQRYLQGKGPLITYTMKIKEDLWQKLRRYSFEKNQSIAFSIQEAIQKLVSDNSRWRRKTD